MRLKPKVPPLRIGAASGPVLRAICYARKSTDDSDRNPDNKSVTRQIERAKAYAASKGWTVVDAFADDGISGFEFKRRPGLLRLLNNLKQFDVIVMSELSRLGREQTQTAHVLAEVYKQKRRVFFYLTDEEVKFTSAVDKFMVSATAFGAELEREKAAQRSLDALERKAAKGFSAGGHCYGLDLVPKYAKNGNGEQVRSHTDFRINRAEAAVIVGIFRAFADGHGMTSVSKALAGNATLYGPKGKRRRVLGSDLDAIRKQYFDGQTPPSPKRGKRGSGIWAASAVREILYRERYRGAIPFNGKLTPRPDLRIVDERLWQRVQQRLKDVRGLYIRNGGEWWGRPSAEKYLLSAMGRCKSCGKSLAIIGGYNGSPGGRKKTYYYGCSFRHTRGDVGCDNNHRARMEWLDAAVIESIRRQLTPEHIALTVEKMAQLVERERKANKDKPRQLEAEARELQAKLDRFMRAIGDGEQPKTILAEIKRLETRLEEIKGEQQRLSEAVPVMTAAQIRDKCGTQLKRFEELLLSDVPLARQALRRLLAEPLQIAPATVQGRRTLRFEGRTTLGPLLDPVYKGLASPRGFEPRLPP